MQTVLGPRFTEPAEPSEWMLVAWIGWSKPTWITRGSGCRESAPGLLRPMRVKSHKSVNELDIPRQFSDFDAAPVARIYSMPSSGNAIKTRRSRFNSLTFLACCSLSPSSSRRRSFLKNCSTRLLAEGFLHRSTPAISHMSCSCGQARHCRGCPRGIQFASL